MIRSTSHHLKDLNLNKLSNYQVFIDDYRKYVGEVIDIIWENGYDKFSIANNALNIPKYIDYNRFSIETPLSSRAKSSACTQITQIIKAVVQKANKTIFVNEKYNKNAPIKPFSKPDISKIRPNLSSKCADFKETPRGKFLGFIRLKSIGKKYGHIRVPVIRHPRSQGKMKGGFLFSPKDVQLVWEQEGKENKGTEVRGADQGVRVILTLSDGQVTPERDPHGFSYGDIILRVHRTRKGSKAHKRALIQRDNFIRWSINQLDLSRIKELRLEKIKNLKFGVRNSKNITNWVYPLIEKKLKSRCEEMKVSFSSQPSIFRSQRCSSCGLVRRANRKGEIYSCKGCGLKIDSDLNAALNHEIDLPPIPDTFRGQRLNQGRGFRWTPSGIFNLDGSEIRVPIDTKSNQGHT